MSSAATRTTGHRRARAAMTGMRTTSNAPAGGAARRLQMSDERIDVSLSPCWASRRSRPRRSPAFSRFAASGELTKGDLGLDFAVSTRSGSRLLEDLDVAMPLQNRSRGLWFPDDANKRVSFIPAGNTP
jgi:hypothetical protein